MSRFWPDKAKQCFLAGVLMFAATAVGHLPTKAAAALRPGYSGPRPRVPVPEPSPNGKYRRSLSPDEIGRAAQILNRRQDLLTPNGLQAVRKFSLIVLRRGLKDHDPLERCYAASALAANGDPSGEPLLYRAFMSGDPVLRMAVTDGLADMNNAEGVALLEALYATTVGDPLATLILIHGLASIHDRSVEPFLLRQLGSSVMPTRLMAARALGELGDRSVLPRLRVQLGREQSPYARAVVAAALFRLGDTTTAAEPLKAALAESSVDAVRVAIRTLSRGRVSWAEPMIERLLHHPQPSVVTAAAAGLTHYGNTAGVPILAANLADSRLSVRQLGTEVLKDLKFPAGRKLLVAALSSPYPDVRLAAARSFGAIGSERDIDVLTAGYRRATDSTTRGMVTWALGRIAGYGSLRPLLEIVQERDPQIRYTAADGLARVVTRLLGDDDRRPAPQLLVRFGAALLGAVVSGAPEA